MTSTPCVTIPLSSSTDHHYKYPEYRDGGHSCPYSWEVESGHSVRLVAVVRGPVLFNLSYITNSSTA